MRRRSIITLLAALLLLAGACSVGLWFFLSSWVPTAGKARLVQELERRFPITVSIGALRAEWPQGVVMHDLTVTRRGTDEVWLEAPTLRLRMGWLTLALRNQAVFHLTAPLTVPCATDATLSGRYDLRAASLSAALRSGPIAVASIAPFARRHLPPELADGELRLNLRARQWSPPGKPGAPLPSSFDSLRSLRTTPRRSGGDIPSEAPPAKAGARVEGSPQQPLRVEGRIAGSRVVWALAKGRVTGDVVIDGAVQAPAAPKSPWTVETDLSLSNGEAADLPAIGAVTHLAGRARFAQQRWTIQEVTGAALGSTWKVEGAADAAAYELLITSKVASAPLLAAVPDLARQWQPDGTVDLRSVCRGSLKAGGLTDCLIEAGTKRLQVAGARLSRPVEQITGRADFDLLTKTLTLHEFHARLRDQPVALSGRLVLSAPASLLLDIDGRVPLAAAADWLPPTSTVTALDGMADVALHLEGRVSALDATGQITLQDASVTAGAQAVSHLDGVVLLHEDHLTIEQLSAQIKDKPLTAIATITPSPFMQARRRPAVFQIDTAVEGPWGQMAVNGRMDPEEIAIDEGTIKLPRSRLEVTGTVARSRGQPSRLALSGRLALEELTHLPFLPLPALAAWRMQGAADVQAKFYGRLADWPGAALQARLQAEAASIRDLPIEQLRCTIDQERGVLRLRIPSAVAAGGTLTGDLAVEQHPQAHRYALQADLVSLQLERLSGAVPAWRQRPVSGRASAHAMLTGIWERRPTWQGEGWLNVEGRQLGNVPLLDALFRGLFGVLADRMGFDMLRRAEITQAAVQWQLVNERLRTDNLRLGGMAGTEPVAVYAKGSVGLDQTLDFVVEPELSEGALLQAPTTSTLASTVLKAAGQLDRLRRLIGRHRLTGTLKQPEYRFELGAQETINQLTPAPSRLLQGIQGLLDPERQSQP